MKPWLVFAVLAAASLAGLGAMSVVDYDEASYAEISREMFVRGDAIVPSLDGRDYFEKPPFLYWTQMLGYQLFGVNAFGARVLNVIGALLTLLALYLFARGPLGERGALRSVIVLGTSIAFVVMTRVTLTDTWLTFWLVLCLGMLHRAFEPEGGLRFFLLASFAAGMAMLTKGAIGLLLPGAALLFYAWRIRALRKLFRPAWILPAAVTALTVGMSWYVLLGLTQPDGFGFMRELFLEHHVDRFLKPAHKHHRGPFFYYLIVVFFGFMPFAFYIVPSLTKAMRPERESGRRLLLLFGAFTAITLVFFSIAATKLPNYATPLYPFLALAIGAALGRIEGPPTGRLWRPVGALSAVGACVAGAVLIALPSVLTRLPDVLDDRAFANAPGLAYPFDAGPAPYLAGGLLIGFGVLCFVTGLHRRPERLVVPLGAVSLASMLLIVLGLGARIDAHFFQPLTRVAQRAAKDAPYEDRIALAGLKYRPSTIFYGGRLTRYVSLRRDEEIASLFAGPDPVDTIVAEVKLDRLREFGSVEVVLSDTGYVLVRCSPP